MLSAASFIQEVEALRKEGLPIKIVERSSQAYAHVTAVAAPTPPWDKATYPILVVLPADDWGSLDGFYLGLPYRFSGGVHPRVGNSGSALELLGQTWQLVSWHYPEGKAWQIGTDCLATHLAHCRGFFLHRGATNGY